MNGGSLTTIDTLNVRLMGTFEECQEAIYKLDVKGIEILDVSKFYPNRGNTKTGRVYITIRL